MSKKKYIIIFILCLVFLNIYPKNTRQTSAGTLSHNEQARFEYYFFEAQRLKDIKQYDAEMEALKMCLAIDSTGGAAQSEMGLLLARMNRIPEAARAFKKSVQASPENWWYRVQYITMLSSREQHATAIEQALELKKYYPEREDVYTMLASLYKRTGEYDKAIDAINQLEMLTGINEYLTFEKFQLYALLNQEKKAIEEITRLVQKYPKESRYQVLLGDVYMEQKQSGKAFEIYQQVLKDDPNSPYVYVSLANYYKQQNQPDKALNAIVTALKNPQVPSDVKMDMLAQYVERLLSGEQKIDETEKLFKMLIEMYPLDEMPHAYYARFLQTQKRNDEALEELENVISINPKDEAAWKTSLQILTQSEDTAKILKLTERAIKILPKVPEFYFYRSIAQFQQAKYQDALQTNEEALKNIGSSATPTVISSFYGQIGDIYYQMKDKQKAFENYDKALEASPVNIYVMNNYAYYLSEEKTDLRKAERMSGKTVELEPNNSTYLDTYAWIFYQQGNFDLAKLYMDKAISSVKPEEDAGVLYEHSGDIYAALNETDKALEMWQKAYELTKDAEKKSGLKAKIDDTKLKTNKK